MLNRTHHVAIISSDYGKAVDFYVTKLGFSAIREVERKEQRDILMVLRSGETVLELFIKPDAPRRVTCPEAQGLRHLAFAVPSVDDMVRELESKGVPCEPIRLDSYTNKPMTFFRDPDGLPIEIHE